MAYIGLTDALGTAGVLAGFFLWRSGRTRSATVAFALAILAKETGVLAVAALLIVERRRAIGLLWSVAPYAIWLVVIRLRLDVWSFAASSDGARYTAPFQGWWRAARDWGAVQWLVLSAIGVLVAVSWRRLPIELRWFSVLWIGLATCFGWQVWSKALDFPRVLLPLQVVAAICLLPSLRTGASSPEVLAPVSAGRVGLRARRSPTD